MTGFVAEVPAHQFDPVFGDGATGYGKVRGRMVTPWGEIDVRRLGPAMPLRVTAVRRKG